MLIVNSALQIRQQALHRRLAEQQQVQIDKLTQMKQIEIPERDTGPLSEEKRSPKSPDILPSYKQVIRTVDRQRKFTARFQTPRWLPAVCRSWELCGYTNRAGWTASFQTYPILPKESDTWTMVLNGDIHGLQKVLQQGNVSLYSRDRYGYTFLDVSNMMSDAFKNYGPELIPFFSI